jgi:hypothetical protein
MSLRPEVRGFDLPKLRSWFGSGDASVVAAIERELALAEADPEADVDDQFRETFREALHRAVFQGVPFPDLDAEREPHVDLAILLAGHGQEFLETDSNDWKMVGFDEFWKHCRGALGSGGDLFAYFLEGRPLFGKRIETVWSYYGYLSQLEVRRLRTSLAKLLSRHPRLAEIYVVEDLASDLTRWCDEILGANKDLWFWTA